MKQGDVYLVDLNPPHRTEVGKIRPALIISINEMNDHAPRVIVAPITSNIKKVYKSEMLIHPIGGLTKESKVMLNQIRSIDKGRLRDRLGQVDRPTLKAACELAIKLIKPQTSQFLDTSVTVKVFEKGQLHVNTWKLIDNGDGGHAPSGCGSSTGHGPFPRHPLLAAVASLELS